MKYTAAILLILSAPPALACDQYNCPAPVFVVPEVAVQAPSPYAPISRNYPFAPPLPLNVQPQPVWPVVQVPQYVAPAGQVYRFTAPPVQQVPRFNVYPVPIERDR